MKLNSFAQQLPIFICISQNASYREDTCILPLILMSSLYRYTITYKDYTLYMLLHADCFTCKTDGVVQFSFLFSVWSAAVILAS